MLKTHHCFNIIAVAAFCLSAVPVYAGGLGEAVQDFQLRDYRGNEVSLSDFDQSELVVLAFMGTECPLAKLYSSRLQELSEKYSDSQLTVVAVNSNVQDSVKEIDAWARQHGVKFSVLKDPAQVVADLVNAERTPQMFLLDKNRVVRYQGRIDDQYVIGIVRDAPTRADLQIAIDELLAGKKVTVNHTQPLGCLIGRSEKPNENSTVTYSNQIARIFQKRCVGCHRSGEIAPFPLESYDDAFGWGPMIEEVVREQRMPPWHADPKHGKFSNDSSLSKSEKELIYEWVKNGSPEGDPKKLPEPIKYISGWQIAKQPDAIFNMAKKPFKVAANGGPNGVPYQHFWVETNFTEDKWVIAAEARPGNHTVVHHIIVYLYPNGKGTQEREHFCAYVPGLRQQEPIPGYAKKIPAGAALRFEMHYTPTGSEQQDISSVGFVFTEPKNVTHKIVTMYAGNNKFKLKPHKDNQVVKAKSITSSVDVQLLTMAPHMHLRGKSFKYEALFPDGTREVLLDVPNYDFNWQTAYRLAEPRTLPADTRLLCTATFDNSEDNLANPDPSETVSWGDQSQEEMMLGYYDILIPVNPQAEAFKLPTDINNITADTFLKILDKDGDRNISRREAQVHSKLRQGFKYMDHNKNGMISEEELDLIIKVIKSKRKMQ